MSKSKLIISDYYNAHLLGFEFHNDKVMRIHNFQGTSVLGNIYCGYVRDVVKNLNAAFVEFENQKGFLSLKDFPGIVRQGDRVMVQVSGEQIKSKEYSLTWHINLASECLALTVGNTNISVSRKIEDHHIRSELKKYLSPFQNDEYGFILRTSSEKYTKEEIVSQARELIKQYQTMKHKFTYATPKTAIIKKNYILECCKNFQNKYFGEIITDHKEMFQTLNNALLNVSYYEKEKVSLSNQYSLDKYLREALGKKVWLKSGAYLVIEYTEAMTVIDVNTGKAETKTDRETMFWTINLEAVREIVRQIMVRNISGIIMIDFINMKNPENYRMLEQEMKQEIRQDFSQCDFAGFTHLGLMELSRKKCEKPIYEILRER